jgi:hypothetical protein
VPLIAILCPERSGSTMLAAMLGGHSRMLAPPELHLLRYPSFEEWLEAYSKAMTSLQWLMARLGQPAEAKTAEQRFAGWATVDVYQELLALAGPGLILIDKTPAYARTEDALARLEALAPRYIWLVRHPLAVASSMLERDEQMRAAAGRPPKKVRSWWRRLLRPDPVRRALRNKVGYWRDVHARIERHLASVPRERILVVHYEELVRHPEAEMSRLAAGLGVELEPGMLTPWNNVPDVLGWGIGDEKALRTRRFDAARADAWRGRLSERVLDARARALMVRLGVG